MRTTCRSRVGATPWLLAAALVAVAMNLRSPLAATSTVEKAMQGDLGMSAGQFGALAGIPVLCFALGIPLSTWVIGRLGARRAASLSMIGIAVAELVRSFGGPAVVVVATVVLGLSISIGNLAMPVIVFENFAPDQAGLITGFTTVGFNIGSVVTTSATAPLALAFGWRTALALWALMALFGWAMLWVSAHRPRRRFPSRDTATKTGPIESAAARSSAGALATSAITLPITLPRGRAATGRARFGHITRFGTVWLVAVALGLHNLAYTGMTAWLPAILVATTHRSTVSAGTLSSVFPLLGIVGALGTPVLLRRFGPLAASILIGVCWISLPIGLLVAPGAAVLWIAVSGAAQGGAGTLVLTFALFTAAMTGDVRRTNAVVQFTAYLLASIGPSLLGLAHDATGGWVLPLVVVAVALAGLLATSVRAARHLRPYAPGASPARPRRVV